MRLFRYLCVGGIAACTDFVIFVYFAKVEAWNYLGVAAAGFCFATLVNYALSVRFVFRSGVRFERHRELMLVYVVSGIGLALNQAMLYAGVDVFGCDMVLCKLLATAGVFGWNYWARAHFVFASPASVEAS